MKNIKLLVVEFLILFVLMSICILTKNNDDDINILEKNISDWQSKYIAYDEGWHINDESIKTSREVDAIYGPYAFLKRGYYTLKYHMIVNLIRLLKYLLIMEMMNI